MSQGHGWAKQAVPVRSAWNACRGCKARHRGLPRSDGQFTGAMAAYTRVRLPKRPGGAA